MELKYKLCYDDKFDVLYIKFTYNEKSSVESVMYEIIEMRDMDDPSIVHGLTIFNFMKLHEKNHPSLQMLNNYNIQINDIITRLNKGDE